MTSAGKTAGWRTGRSIRVLVLLALFLLWLPLAVTSDATSVAATSALPDLIVNGSVIHPTIQTATFGAANCAVNEGCTQAGTRTLLRFDAETRNIGDADMVLGDPSMNPLFHFDSCHGHYHFEGYAQYRLLNAAGQVAVGRKNAFCLLDSFRFDPAANPARVYNCTFQGIQKGWADVYTSTLPCQWIDVTGVPPGQYTLEVEVNPEHLIAESDYSNNVASVQVLIGITGTPAPTATPTFTPTRTSMPTGTPTPTATVVCTPGNISASGQITYYANGQPVDGVDVQLQEMCPVAAETDAAGQFVLPGIVGGDSQITPRKAGGANDGISALDAAYVLQVKAGSRTFNAQQMLACDVTGDGTLSALDAALILQSKVGLLGRFPAAERCQSDWVFVPMPTGAAHQSLIQPLITSNSCQLGAIAFTPLAQDVTNQDFTAFLLGDCTGNWQPIGGAAVARAGRQHSGAVHMGRPRRDGTRLRLPLYVDATFSALHVQLGHDATHLRLTGVRRIGSARLALLAAHESIPGVVGIALASAVPLPHGAALLLQFEVQGSVRSDAPVRVLDAVVEETAP